MNNKSKVNLIELLKNEMNNKGTININICSSIIIKNFIKSDINKFEQLNIILELSNKREISNIEKDLYKAVYYYISYHLLKEYIKNKLKSSNPFDEDIKKSSDLLKIVKFHSVNKWNSFTKEFN
tara:strand:+ start:340 stop:711 length:372 start_codon:yes stop_codon:yes gene_type:complete